MKDLLELAKNIKKGPKSSIIGLLMFLGGGYTIYTHEHTLTYTSVEVGVFVVGLYLFLSSGDMFSKEEKDEE